MEQKARKAANIAKEEAAYAELRARKAKEMATSQGFLSTGNGGPLRDALGNTVQMPLFPGLYDTSVRQGGYLSPRNVVMPQLIGPGTTQPTKDLISLENESPSPYFPLFGMCGRRRR